MNTHSDLQLTVRWVQFKPLPPVPTSFALLHLAILNSDEVKSVLSTILGWDKLLALISQSEDRFKNYLPSEEQTITTVRSAEDLASLVVVERLLERAVAIAKCEYAAEVRCIHMLQAILESRQNDAGEFLRSLGLSIKRVQQTRIFDTHPLDPNRPKFLDPSIVRESPKERLAVVADLDEVPAEILAEFMGALDALHRAWGGAGLRVEGGTVSTTAAAGERV